MDSQKASTMPLRVDKTIAWLTESRDQWKQKYLHAKRQHQRQH